MNHLAKQQSARRRPQNVLLCGANRRESMSCHIETLVCYIVMCSSIGASPEALLETDTYSTSTPTCTCSHTSATGSMILQQRNCQYRNCEGGRTRTPFSSLLRSQCRVAMY